MTRAFLAAAALAALPLAAPAAQQMRPDARPAAGTLSPRADRPAESLQVALRSGSASGMDECAGLFDPSAPDAVVDWPGGDLQMTVQSEFDATLAVSGPDGTWTCNDDGDGLAPVVEMRAAPRGRYAVWVGSYNEGPSTGATGTLVAGMPPPIPVLMPDATPTSGRLSLAAGFEAQNGLVTQAVQAGGSDSVQRAALQPADDTADWCTGYVDAAHPTVAIDYSGQGTLALTASSADDAMAADLVLIVHTPAGTWRCNDDLLSLNPGINIENATAGRYAVWVGTFGADAGQVAATVTAAETLIEVPEYDGGDYTPMPYSEGRYMPLQTSGRGAVQLRVADAPASGTTTVLPEGQNPVSGMTCSGFIAAAPTASVEMSGQGPFGITATAEDGTDLVLLVQTPDAQWFCSDDADGLNPGIQFGTADDTAVAAGTYRVWVGTLMDPDPMGSMGMDMEGMEGMEPPGPTTVTVTAARGEITVSTPDFGMEGMEDRQDFYEGTYSGQDLTQDNPVTTLALRDGAGQMAVTTGNALVNPVEGDGCRGLIDARPTLAVTVGGTPVSIRASAADQDLVMVARAPSGRWFCSDDAEDSANPRIVTDEAGRYAVWVGTFSRPTQPVQAQVAVSAE